MVIPVILSGGAGTRLWPVSREAHPKPFIKLADGQSLLQKTFLRASTLPHVQEILTITNREYCYKTKDEYQHLAPAITLDYLLEPCGRNTAPAILLAALKVQAKHGDDAVMLVLPADHVIETNEAFARAFADAKQLALQNHLVTFGIVPTEAETAFGYIECSTTQQFAVTRFVEKPDSATAKKYLAAGNYLWNAGIFCFKAGVVIKQFEQHASELFAQAKKCWAATQALEFNQNDMTELDAKTFADLSDISIDYALMEKSDNIKVVPTHFAWNDVGSWDRIIKLFTADDQGNAAVGDAIMINSHNTFVYGDNRVVASVGIDNLVIVDTPDALLVAHRDHTQDVKKVVQQLKTNAHESYKIHRTAMRPWGTYTVLEEGTNFKIKRIVVKAGASLSLQMHHHRSEHWVVVSGTAKVINGEQALTLNTNESTFIPKGHKHRLENPGTDELVLIEVQTGDYLGEDDIVRFDDKYGRHQSTSHTPKVEAIS